MLPSGLLNLLHERDGEALGQAAVDLPFHDERVDHRAAVVHGQEPPHLHLARLAIDIDDGDVGAVGKVMFGGS